MSQAQFPLFRFIPTGQPAARQPLSVGQLPRKQSKTKAAALVLSALFSATTMQAAEVRFDAGSAPKALAERLKSASASLGLPASAPAQDILAAAFSDYRTLVQVYYDQGYFAPTLSITLDGREAATVDLLSVPSTVGTVVITTEPGRKFTFGRAEIAPLPRPDLYPEGTKPDAFALPDAFRPGGAATTRVLRDAADIGRAAWDKAGHPLVELQEQTITANAVEARLDAALRLAPGPRLRLGQMAIDTSKSRMRPDAIARIAGFPTGEVYDPALVSLSAARLRRTGVFSSVRLERAERPNADGTLDYTATFEDLPRRRFTFGVEVNSSEAVEISTSWMHRNLFGGGERLKIDLSLDGVGSSDFDGGVSVRLDRPAALRPDDSLFYLTEIRRLDEEHFSVLQTSAGIGVRRTISETTFIEGSVGLAYARADDAFGQNREFVYLGGRLRGERDKRNEKVNPTAGYYLDGTVLPVLSLNGRGNGVQANIDARGYFALDPGARFVLAGRAQMGAMLGPDLSDVSPTLLYFSGGAGSVRGQEYQSLGVPVNGGIAGGRGYLALSGELRSRVTDTISLVGFYDIGYVDENPFIDSNSRFHAGAGLGLRYDVAGIGPIRLDLAWPVSENTDSGLQFYIGIGQAF